MSRTVLHVDLDAFFCAVEQILNPELCGKAFVVGGSPQGRGVVSSASYPARAYGVRNAMPTSQALRLCPGLTVVPVRHGVYSEYSHRVMRLLRDYGRAFEQISIDEAFLDISGLNEAARVIAVEIQKRILAEVGLPASVGVASNKLVAKIASGRAKPNGILVIEPGQEADFLKPMKVDELWGIGSATAARLNHAGIQTIGDLANANPQSVRAVLGKQAEAAMQRARGIDLSPVEEEHTARSISSERTFARDVHDADALRAALLAMSDEVAARLREDGLYARTVQLKLRWPDFTTITRQATLPVASQLSDDIFAVIEQLWRSVWRPGSDVRLIGVGVSELGTASGQLPLFDADRSEERAKLAQVTDELKAKYGDNIIGRASLRRTRR